MTTRTLAVNATQKNQEVFDSSAKFVAGLVVPFSVTINNLSPIPLVFSDVCKDVIMPGESVTIQHHDPESIRRTMLDAHFIAERSGYEVFAEFSTEVADEKPVTTKAAKVADPVAA